MTDYERQVRCLIETSRLTIKELNDLGSIGHADALGRAVRQVEEARLNEQADIHENSRIDNLNRGQSEWSIR